MNSDSSNEDQDVKPIISPTTSKSSSPIASGLNHGLNSSSPKKWSPGSLRDSNRRSAFLPYRQTSSCTVLTNLQRGNTQAETPAPQSSDINFHTRAGQGEITEQDINCEKYVDVCDFNGLTALHWASAYGQFNAVQLLLKKNAEVDREGPDGETPLIFAASGGHHEVIRLLIENGADVNRTDHLCNSALMYAAKGDHPHSCQELLIHGADFKVENLNDDTAYNIAVDNTSTLAQAVIANAIISHLEININ